MTSWNPESSYLEPVREICHSVPRSYDELGA